MSSFRREGTPSSSKGAVEGPPGSRPSSTTVTSEEATLSPCLPAKKDRPLRTASAESAAANMPMNSAVTMLSSTTVVRREGMLLEPSRQRALSAASPATRSRSRSEGLTPRSKEKPVCDSSPSSAMGKT
jgi:hypothetical protein